MDLKIKDVAELLNLSETTIRRWIAESKIPAYRINHQYRFSRTEIEDWVMKQKLGSSQEGSKEDSQIAEEPAPQKGGNQQYSLYRAVHKGGVFNNIAGSTKEEVIRNTMKVIAKQFDLDADVLTDLLLDRENLMPTALNNGIGVPHTRDFLLKHQDAVAIVFPEKPIEYGALDGQPVHTLFFLFACEDKRHLHLLAKIAHMGSSDEILKMLKQRPNKEKLLDFIKNWEGTSTK